MLLCCLPRVRTPADIGYRDLFRVLIVEFQDAYNFDLRTVKRSCIHIVQPDGRIVPFDTFNLFYRDDRGERLAQLRARVEAAKASGAKMVGALYRRTRRDEAGNRVQRAEIRFDGVAGCLRTPAGGSSRQSILVIENGRIRARLLSGREAARLMGLPEDYRLPKRYTDACHLLGDGVVAPVVRFLAEHLLEPLAGAPAAPLLAAE